MTNVGISARSRREPRLDVLGIVSAMLGTGGIARLGRSRPVVLAPADFGSDGSDETAWRSRQHRPRRPRPLPISFGGRTCLINRKVPITRAIFDQGGYQLLDDVGETIVVPFAGFQSVRHAIWDVRRRVRHVLRQRRRCADVVRPAQVAIWRTRRQAGRTGTRSRRSFNDPGFICIAPDPDLGRLRVDDLVSGHDHRRRLFAQSRGQARCGQSTDCGLHDQGRQPHLS